MNEPRDSRALAAARAEASEWVLRLDRGLTPAEQDAYTQWLAADASHREALAEARWGWDELDRLTGIQDSVHAMPDPDLLRPRRRLARILPIWSQAIGLAAAVALAAVVWWPMGEPAAVTERAATPVAPSRAPSYALAAPIEERTLEDGTQISLNRGAVLEVEFTPEERRVRLVRGEATFTVAKNPVRPFVVHASGVDVRAVGTAFNVRLDSKSVEVLVTEGKVQVTPPPAVVEQVSMAPMVEAGHRTVVSLDVAAPAPQVVAVSPAEVSLALAWQPRLLDFTDEPLHVIVTEFNRRNPVQLVIADPALAALRLTANFRSDNVETFVRLMESDFAMRAEWRGETAILLHRR
jgi:transmembrane sensor